MEIRYCTRRGKYYNEKMTDTLGLARTHNCTHKTHARFCMVLDTQRDLILTPKLLTQNTLTLLAHTNATGTHKSYWSLRPPTPTAYSSSSSFFFASEAAAAASKGGCCNTASNTRATAALVDPVTTWGLAFWGNEE